MSKYLNTSEGTTETRISAHYTLPTCTSYFSTPEQKKGLATSPTCHLTCSACIIQLSWLLPPGDLRVWDRNYSSTHKNARGSF